MARIQDRSVTSLDALRRRRFTLRMVVAAERDGLLTVDLETGTVAINGARPRQPERLLCPAGHKRRKWREP